jgi:hypothetical protein
MCWKSPIMREFSSAVLHGLPQTTRTFVGTRAGSCGDRTRVHYKYSVPYQLIGPKSRTSSVTAVASICWSKQTARSCGVTHCVSTENRSSLRSAPQTAHSGDARHAPIRSARQEQRTRIRHRVRFGLPAARWGRVRAFFGDEESARRCCGRKHLREYE